MRRFHLLSACLAGFVLLAVPQLTSTDVRAQAGNGAVLFGGDFCPGGANELGRPVKDVRLCPNAGVKYLGTIFPHRHVVLPGRNN